MWGMRSVCGSLPGRRDAAKRSAGKPLHPVPAVRFGMSGGGIAIPERMVSAALSSPGTAEKNGGIVLNVSLTGEDMLTEREIRAILSFVKKRKADRALSGNRFPGISYGKEAFIIYEAVY